MHNIPPGAGSQAPLELKKHQITCLPAGVFRIPEVKARSTSTDLIVLGIICSRRIFRRWITYPVPIVAIMEETPCSERAAKRSVAWWLSIGALQRSPGGPMGVFIIPEDMPPFDEQRATRKAHKPIDIHRYTKDRFEGKKWTEKQPPVPVSDDRIKELVKAIGPALTRKKLTEMGRDIPPWLLES